MVLEIGEKVVKVLGGPFDSVSFGTRYFKGTRTIQFISIKNMKTGTYDASDVVQVELVTQQNKTSIGRAFGWGAVGTLVAGPAGLIVGGLLGGSKNQTLLAVQFADGLQVLISCKAKEAEEWLGMRFNHTPERIKNPPVMPFVLGLIAVLVIGAKLGIFF